MTLSSPKDLYQRFLQGHEGKLHFAAHSHHFWPDISREAQLAYWDDCALLSDEKWSKIFGQVLPQTQKYIAQILNLKHHEQIVIAPNTHELSTRLLSLFLGRSELKILTTTNEFYSWRRQFLRLQEIPQIHIHQVDSSNFMTDRKTFLEAMKDEFKKNYDVVFLSQVFFDSGVALRDDELLDLVNSCPKQTLFVVDGYHGFGAIPTDLSLMENRIFYLGGGYKYAQAGEGVGFMVIPQGQWRPAYTGWFAEQAHLTKQANEQVAYSQDAMAFMGATQDPSGLYRFNAVWNLLAAKEMDIQSIHSYVVKLQQEFLKNYPHDFISTWKLTPLFDEKLLWHGHFLTFEAPSIEAAEKCHLKLQQADILIDRRGARLRFGFGLYQDRGDVIKLCECLQKLAKNSQ
jgi:selenocysteine lyase/cysteine desulfurase